MKYILLCFLLKTTADVVAGLLSWDVLIKNGGLSEYLELSHNLCLGVLSPTL